MLLELALTAVPLVILLVRQRRTSPTPVTGHEPISHVRIIK